MGLRLKKLFPNEDITEEYSALHYRTDFTFKKHMLVVEIELAIKSNHSIKSKYLKWIIKKILPNYKEWKIRNQK